MTFVSDLLRQIQITLLSPQTITIQQLPAKRSHKSDISVEVAASCHHQCLCEAAGVITFRDYFSKSLFIHSIHANK